MKVKVRIAVAVDPTGAWNSCGAKHMRDKDAMLIAAEVLYDNEAHYWLTAELDVPEPREIEATVEKA